MLTHFLLSLWDGKHVRNPQASERDAMARTITLTLEQASALGRAMADEQLSHGIGSALSALGEMGSQVKDLVSQATDLVSGAVDWTMQALDRAQAITTEAETSDTQGLLATITDMVSGTLAATKIHEIIEGSIFKSWLDHGGTIGIAWMASPRSCPVCKDNAQAGPLAPSDLPFPSGHSHPPAHPNCSCNLAMVKEHS